MNAPIIHLRKYSLSRFLITTLHSCLVPVLGIILFSTTALAQRSEWKGLGGTGLGETNSTNPVEFSADWSPTEDGTAVSLRVTAVLDPVWHIYSITQKKDGPRPTTLSIASPSDVKLASDFVADSPPAVSESDFYPGVPIEEHNRQVRWTAKLTVPNGFDGDIKVRVSGLVCRAVSSDGGCVPIDETIVASMRASQSIAAIPSASKPAASMKQALSKQLGGKVDLLAMMSPEHGGAQRGGSRHAGSLRSNPLTVVADPLEQPDLDDAYRDEQYVVAWIASVEPSAVPIGGKAVLKFTAIPDHTFHVYEAKVDDGEFATNFVITGKSDLKVGAPQANQPVIRQKELPSLPPIGTHHGPVTWSLPIEIPADTAPGLKLITGMIGYQACTDTSCQPPNGLKFVASLKVLAKGKPADGEVDPVTFSKVGNNDAMDAAADTKWVDPVKMEIHDSADPSGGDTSSVGDHEKGGVAHRGGSDSSTQQGSTGFSVVLMSAFIGGFILNFMPCVLPVIGLKVMSFVSQAGEDRRRVLHLNLAYVGGIFFVFAILAFLAISYGFGWGDQFKNFSVRLGAIVAIFAFALSYFDVWEIAVPGFASGSKSQDLQNQEGLRGAFSKGIFTTILATPCSGPFLGAAFAATVAYSAPETALVFALVALGMSSPYILLGLRPQLVKYLPKPGPWMETFKQLMGFSLLVAVCYFFYQFADSDKLSVFVTLMGVWFGMWIIGKVPSWETINKRLIAWTAGIATATAIGVFAFTGLNAPSKLEWIDFTNQKLAAHQDSGKTVLVDFSAKWCPTCLYNLQTAIDTRETRKLMDELGAVSMYADLSDLDSVSEREASAKLKELQAKSIPVLAIYPAGRPHDPIVLFDVVTQQAVLDALRQAGPSKPGLAWQPEQDIYRTAVLSTRH